MAGSTSYSRDDDVYLLRLFIFKMLQREQTSSWRLNFMRFAFILGAVALMAAYTNCGVNE